MSEHEDSHDTRARTNDGVRRGSDGVRQMPERVKKKGGNPDPTPSVGKRVYGPVGSNEPVTRATGRTPTVEMDASSSEEYVTVRSRTGRLVTKNRSDGWRGYKSHLTKKQRHLIAWALRQRDRGCSRLAVWEKLMASGQWVSGPMQYPPTMKTLAGWEAVRGAEESKGRNWPLP